MKNNLAWEQVKCWPWKRIILGTAVISSIAASTSFGTYAYFTSQKEDSTTFAAGKLEINLGTTKATFKAEDNKPFLPGVRFEKEITIDNSSDVPVKYALLAEKKSGDDVVYNQLVVEITHGGDGDSLLYRGRVSELSQANVVVPELEKGGNDDLRYTVYLPESTGNEVQQKTAEVNFGFLATQQDNGEFFAQKGPVMTFTPDDLNGSKLTETLEVMKKSNESMTFILGEGTYDLSGLSLPGHVTWKATKGKEGKVIIQANDLTVKDASFEGITFSGSGQGLIVESNVVLRDCTFDGNFEAAIQTASKGEVEGVTVQGSKFSGGQNAILLNEAAKGVLIVGNEFDGVNHAVVVANDKETQVQIVNNNFTKVNGYAVDSGGVRVGDGIDGFKEINAENEETQKLAIHLQKADLYLENNKYGK